MLAHTPAGGSTREVMHYAQGALSGKWQPHTMAGEVPRAMEYLFSSLKEVSSQLQTPADLLQQKHKAGWTPQPVSEPWRRQDSLSLFHWSNGRSLVTRKLEDEVTFHQPLSCS
jgi:hypothetical protein